MNNGGLDVHESRYLEQSGAGGYSARGLDVQRRNRDQRRSARLYSRRRRAVRRRCAGEFAGVASAVRPAPIAPVHGNHTHAPQRQTPRPLRPRGTVKELKEDEASDFRDPGIPSGLQRDGQRAVRTGSCRGVAWLCDGGRRSRAHRSRGWLDAAACRGAKIKVEVTMTIPVGHRQLDCTRLEHPSTISPLTQSVGIAINGGGAHVFNATTSSSACSIGPSGTVCTFGGFLCPGGLRYNGHHDLQRRIWLRSEIRPGQRDI